MNMPDMVNVPQPPHSMLLRQGKEGFPEYLKHTSVLGDKATPLKLTASNSLFHAVLKGRLRGTRYLLDRTASVNGRNDYGYSVLTAALHVEEDGRRDKVFRLLLERGADPLFVDSKQGRNVLHWACLLGRTQQVKTLLRDVGGDVDLGAKDGGSQTALHHAVMAGHLPIVSLLVNAHRKFGVSVDLPDRMGLTPYLHAKRLGYRDVAEHLRTEGQASQGHGDLLFRTPREWSQIGKFERQKAIEVTTQEAITVAKIKGKITHVRQLEDSLSSPRMALPNLLLPSYSPSHHPGVRLARRYTDRYTDRRYTDRLSRSLPSLKEPLPALHLRPSSANGQAGSEDVGEATARTDNPHAPKEAFSEGGDQTSRLPQAGQGAPAAPAAAAPAAGAGGVTHGATGAGGDSNPLPRGAGHTSSALSRSGNMAVLMEMNDKGRHARSYRQSQFDETKASEYKHMLGNLNCIMDLLSQQQSKSFRQSVRYQKPETPKRRKPRSKVSSLAVIFGRDKSGRRSHKKRSPKPSGKKREAGKKDKAAEEARKIKVPERKKVVPLVKVNDRVM